jgi:diguanylate cyclase (GGDEF)-like protein
VRNLARIATSSLVALCIGLSLVVVAVTAIGILSARASTDLGKQISGNELATSTETGELARNMDTAYVTGEEAFLTPKPAIRSRLLSWMYTSLLPATDDQVTDLVRLHAGDPPAEQADIRRFVRQWLTVRDVLSPTNVASHPAAMLATDLSADYLPLGQHLDRLFLVEQAEGQAQQLTATENAERTTWLLVAFGAAGLLAGGFLLYYGIRRIRRALQPGQDQEEFADTMMIASDEDEAHLLLQRYLERILGPRTIAVVLNSNNSADRLEAVVPLPDGSPLAQTLRGAEPRSCLAVRSGRTHREGGGRLALLSCPVCAPCPGASSCVPLVVGGKVIGSVLLSRPTPYDDGDEQRIRESVSQAAPVLANLRNLAIAEFRAATDGLTGLPNKRAVTDTLKRMFAQAATERSPLALLMLDLDHFKKVNDQRGHAVGDQVLANVGAVMRSSMRSRDFAGRNGGEEFAILLPDTEIPVALRIAERVRAAIAEMSLPGTDVAVTVSIGVAGYPEHASTPDRLARLADAALYLAKRQGRNRVELAEPSVVVGAFDPAGLAAPPAPPAPPGPGAEAGPAAPAESGPAETTVAEPETASAEPESASADPEPETASAEPESDPIRSAADLVPGPRTGGSQPGAAAHGNGQGPSGNGQSRTGKGQPTGLGRARNRGQA